MSLSKPTFIGGFCTLCAFISSVVVGDQVTISGENGKCGPAAAAATKVGEGDLRRRREEEEGEEGGGGL